jgi:hypothetical protein
MPTGAAQVFLARAKQLGDAASLMRDDAPYASATALTAVHSAIAYQDALQSNLTGRRYQGRDHMQAVESLEKTCKQHKVGTDGIKHLRRLVGAKSKISYGDRLTTLEQAQDLAYRAARFQQWAIKELATLRMKEDK